MKYLVIILCLCSQVLLAQTDLEQKVNSLAAENKIQNTKITELQSITDIHNYRLDTATNIAYVNRANIRMISDTLHLKVLDAHSDANHAHAKIDEMDSEVDRNRNYWIGGSALFVILLGLVFFMLKKQIETAAEAGENARLTMESLLKKEATRLENELVNTKEELGATNKKLIATNKELHATNQALENSQNDLNTVQKELEATNKALVSTNEELEATSQRLNDLNKKE